MRVIFLISRSSFRRLSTGCSLARHFIHSSIFSLAHASRMTGHSFSKSLASGFSSIGLVCTAHGSKASVQKKVVLEVMMAKQANCFASAVYIRGDNDERSPRQGDTGMSSRQDGRRIVGMRILRRLRPGLLLAATNGKTILAPINPYLLAHRMTHC